MSKGEMVEDKVKKVAHISGRALYPVNEHLGIILSEEADLSRTVIRARLCSKDPPGCCVQRD